MKNHFLKLRQTMMIRLALPLFFVVTFFQNCSSPMSSSQPSDHDIADGQKIIGTTSEFDRVVLGLSPNDPLNQNSLHVDLNSGSAKLKKSDQDLKNCAVSPEEFNGLKSILDSAGICEPGPLPDGTAVCLAIGVADIELSSSVDHRNVAELRPVVCHNGTFLCDGLDKPFREALRKIADDCQ